MSEIKEFEVKVSVRNNRIKQRRIEAGWSQPRLAELVGVSVGVIVGFETMAQDPVSAKGGWKPSAKMLADYLCVDPAELWPDCVLAVEKSTVFKRVSADELQPLLSGHQIRSLASPEDVVEQEELSAALDGMIDELTPRERDVITRRFGLNGADPQELEAVGKDIGVSPERIRQIETKAIRKLRHPSRARKVSSFLSLGQKKEQADRELIEIERARERERLEEELGSRHNEWHRQGWI